MYYNYNLLITYPYPISIIIDEVILAILHNYGLKIKGSIDHRCLWNYMGRVDSRIDARCCCIVDQPIPAGNILALSLIYKIPKGTVLIVYF